MERNHHMTTTAQAPSLAWLPDEPDKRRKVEQALEVTATSRKVARDAEAKITPPAPQRQARISIDRPWIGRLLAALVTTQVAALLFISINGLMEIGRWMGTWELLLAVSLDATLITATGAALVFRSRGERGHAFYAWFVLILFSGISMALNAAHILVTDEPTQQLIAAGCYALIYIAALLIIHLGVLVFIAPPEGSPEMLRAQQRIADRGSKGIFDDAQSRVRGTPQRYDALETIHELKQTGMSNRQIAEALKTDPTTVRNALAEFEEINAGATP
jgi:hypothetical protein